MLTHTHTHTHTHLDVYPPLYFASLAYTIVHKCTNIQRVARPSFIPHYHNYRRLLFFSPPASLTRLREYLSTFLLEMNVSARSRGSVRAGIRMRKREGGSREKGGGGRRRRGRKRELIELPAKLLNCFMVKKSKHNQSRRREGG